MIEFKTKKPDIKVLLNGKVEISFKGDKSIIRQFEGLKDDIELKDGKYIYFDPNGGSSTSEKIVCKTYADYLKEINKNSPFLKIKKIFH